MCFEIDVAKRIGEIEIRVAISAGPGLTALFGPSGCGKTSVLDMVAGLLRPDAGRIAVAGETLFGEGTDLPPERRGAGYVFQDRRLFPHMSVRANLIYGMRAPTVPAEPLETRPSISLRTNGGGEGAAEGAKARDPVMDLDATARFLGIAHLLDRRPRTLSGGEAQRVAIGRALLSGPRFLLLDEPLVALDRARAEGIMAVIERIRDELRLPILYVSHSAAEVERLATTVIGMPR